MLLNRDLWKEVRLLGKAERYTNREEYNKAYNLIEEIGKKDKIYRPQFYKITKLRLDFLTHKFDTVLADYQELIELLNRNKNLNNSQKNYRKAYVYSMVHFIYRLKNEPKEAGKYLNEMKSLEMNAKKLSDRFLLRYTPVTRIDIKILFQDEYYQENYSKKLLDNIRYDSGEMGFIEDLYIVEGSDNMRMFFKLTKYLLIFMSIVGVSVWFIRMDMVQTAMVFVVLSGLSIYIYLEYRDR